MSDYKILGSKLVCVIGFSPFWVGGPLVGPMPNGGGFQSGSDSSPEVTISGHRFQRSRPLCFDCSRSWRVFGWQGTVISSCGLYRHNLVDNIWVPVCLDCLTNRLLVPSQILRVLASSGFAQLNLSQLGRDELEVLLRNYLRDLQISTGELELINAHCQGEVPPLHVYIEAIQG